jgi:hypothetical protein
MRAALAAAATLALCGTAAAATVDPVAILMQQSIKKALQADMAKQAPGMKVTTVTCTVSKDASSGTCRANFAFKTLTGYYMLKVVQPSTGRPSYRSTSVHCFVAKSGKALPCSR